MRGLTGIADFLARSMATAAVRIGVIADIQYADCEDGTDFSGAQRRTYRGSLTTARRATASWEAGGGLALLAQLGDLLDGRAGAQGTRDQDCAAVLATLAACQTPDPQENPTWFIPSTEKPSGVDDQSFCQGEMDSPDTEFYQTRTSEILLPESLPPAICIIFPFQPNKVL